MSLNSESDGGIPKLRDDCSNWRLWIERVEDYLRGRKHYRAEDIIAASWWNGRGQDPAIEYRNLPVDNDDNKAFKIIHQQAFGYVRRALSDALFSKTLELTHKTVPDLLRLLRNEWNDGSVIDRARLRDEMDEMNISKFQNYNEYEAAFKNLCSNLEANGVTTYVDDEEKLYKFTKGLDPTWRIPIEMVSVNEKAWKEATAYFRKVAKQNPNVTGIAGCPTKTL